MLIQRSQVAVETEAVEGTAETLEAADVFLAFNPDFQPNIEAHERDPVRSVLSPYGSVFGKRSASMTLEAELVGTAAAGSANHLSDLLKACGIGETLVADTSATYKPATASIPSVTMAQYMDGKIYKMWGARATAKLLLEAGKPGIFTFDCLGADFSDTDGDLLEGVTYNAVKPPTFQNATLTIDSYAAIVSRVELDFGNVLALRTDAAQPGGNLSAAITNRRPTISFDPENVLVATEDFLGNWRSGSEMAFTATIGSDTGNTIAITAPKVQYQEARLADRDGISIVELVGLCCLNSGDDEWQIQIT